jgi:hypothetical protein
MNISPIQIFIALIQRDYTSLDNWIRDGWNIHTSFTFIGVDGKRCTTTYYQLLLHCPSYHDWLNEHRWCGDI